MSRYPFAIPYGWFCVSWSDEIAPGDIKPVRYFGRELVVWRDHQGAAHVMDAFCPHLGAHLGHGGHVEDCRIVCPFHGWAFDGEGANVDIPYSDRVNKKAGLRTYETREADEFIMVWYHPDHTEPEWELPEIPMAGDPDWSGYDRRHKSVAANAQELCENSVDSAHFEFVHGTDTVPVLESCTFEGPHMTMRSAQRFVTPKGVVDARIDVDNWGPGIAYVTFSGIVDTLTVSLTTPVDDNHTEVRFNYKVRRQGDMETTSTVSKAFVDMVDSQFEEDRPIWEHKAHLVRPALIDTDGPFMQFRKWYGQFHPGGFDPDFVDPLGQSHRPDAGRDDRAAALAKAREATSG